MGSGYMRSFASVLFRFFGWILGSVTAIIAAASFQGNPAPSVMAIVSAAITFFIYPIVFALKDLIIAASIVDFLMFALWLTPTCLYSFYSSCNSAESPKNNPTACLNRKLAMWISGYLALSHLAYLFLQLVFVHYPSWKYGVALTYSKGLIFAEPFTGDLKRPREAIVVAPKAGKDLELGTLVVDPEAAKLEKENSKSAKGLEKLHKEYIRDELKKEIRAMEASRKIDKAAAELEAKAKELRRHQKNTNAS